MSSTIGGDERAYKDNICNLYNLPSKYRGQVFYCESKLHNGDVGSNDLTVLALISS